MPNMWGSLNCCPTQIYAHLPGSYGNKFPDASVRRIIDFKTHVSSLPCVYLLVALIHRGKCVTYPVDIRFIHAQHLGININTRKNPSMNNGNYCMRTYAHAVRSRRSAYYSSIVASSSLRSTPRMLSSNSPASFSLNSRAKATSEERIWRVN